MWLFYLWSWLTITSWSLWSRVSGKSLITLEIKTTSKELICLMFQMSLSLEEIVQ